MKQMQLNDMERVCFKAYQEMTGDTKKVADDFERKQVALTQNDLLLHYDLGARLNVEMPGRADVSNAMQQMAVVTGRSASALDAMRKFASAFSRDFIEQVARRRTSDGRHLTVHHLFIVASLKTDEERRQRLQQMLEHPLGARELNRDIKALGLEPKIRSKVRRVARQPESPPRSPLRAITAMIDGLNTLNGRMEAWTEYVFDAIDQKPPDEFDDRYVAQLQRALAEVIEARSSLVTLRERLTAARDRCQKLLAARQQCLSPALSPSDMDDGRIVATDPTSGELDDADMESMECDIPDYGQDDNDDDLEFDFPPVDDDDEQLVDTDPWDEPEDAPEI